MINLKKYEGESDLAFGIRCCEAKTTETWEELGNYINKICGTTYTSSKWRKAYQYYELVKNELKDKTIEEQKQELEDIKEQIKSERIKLQTCNLEKNRYIRQDARHDLWIEQIGDCITKLEPPKLETIDVKKSSKKYIQAFGDIHFGSCFTSTTNEYSPKIVKERFEILKNETIDFIKEKGLEELTIVDVGDQIQGILRMQDLSANDSTVVKATVEVAQLISTYLNDLSAYCDIVYYDVMYANHSQQRYLGSKANAFMTEDIGYIIGCYIRDVLSNNDRITVKLPKDNDLYLEIDNIFDWNIIACHGHQIKNINDSLKDLSMQRRKFYDCVLLGHFHSNTSVTVGESYSSDCEVLVVPSVVGSDNFADSLFRGSKASSMIYGFDDIKGHTETYKIILN